MSLRTRGRTMRTVVVVLVIMLSGMAASPPAVAQQPGYQTRVQLRYWAAGFGCAGAISITDSTHTFGATLRLDSRTSPWGFSVRYDSMQPAQWFSFGSTTLCGRSSQSLWDGNVHYRFGSLDSYVGLFVGYGGISQSGGPAFSTSGLRFGGEFLTGRQSGWYLTGEAAFGPSWASHTGVAGTANGDTRDYRVAVGYEVRSGSGIELGWRSYSWTIPSSPGCTAGCNFDFNGVTLALTYRR